MRSSDQSTLSGKWHVGLSQWQCCLTMYTDSGFRWNRSTKDRGVFSIEDKGSMEIDVPMDSRSTYFWIPESPNKWDWIRQSGDTEYFKSTARSLYNAIWRVFAALLSLDVVIVMAKHGNCRRSTFWRGGVDAENRVGHSVTAKSQRFIDFQFIQGLLRFYRSTR